MLNFYSSTQGQKDWFHYYLCLDTMRLSAGCWDEPPELLCSGHEMLIIRWVSKQQKLYFEINQAFTTIPFYVWHCGMDQHHRSHLQVKYICFCLCIYCTWDAVICTPLILHYTITCAVIVAVKTCILKYGYLRGKGWMISWMHLRSAGCIVKIIFL